MVALVKEPISPQPHPARLVPDPLHTIRCLIMPVFPQHRVSTAGFSLRPAVRVSPTEGCRPLALSGVCPAGSSQRKARERGALDTPASRLPRYPNHPRGIPWPRLSSWQQVDVSRRKGAGQPGARHGTSTDSRHGLALLGSALGRHCSSRDRHLYSQETARDLLDGQKQAGERRERTGWGGGEKENNSTDVGCHGQRYTGDVGASRCASRAEELREVAGTSRPDVSACAPGGLSRGASAYRHLRRKELHDVPRGQSQSFPMRAPFLTAHCSPASHCGQRPAVSGTATSGHLVLSRRVLCRLA